MLLPSLSRLILPEIEADFPLRTANLAKNPHRLPVFVRRCPVAMRYLTLFSPLAWHAFPDRSLKARGRHQRTFPLAGFAAAFLIKLNEGFRSTGDLRRFLVEHPALSWLLGFATRRERFNLRRPPFQTQLPRTRHFNRILRILPNAALQTLLTSSVHLLQAELRAISPEFGHVIALDTKLILGWVKENNPKAYVKERYNPDRQPRGDADCRLGVKRRRNVAPDRTPLGLPLPAGAGLVRRELYWGYASGIVTTKVPDWGEVVLAELTQPFNRADVSYFFPLMALVEDRLGFRPRIGALDAAFDAFYVYEHFHQRNGSGFAAVPLAKKGGYAQREFDPDGLPLCAAGLAMPLKFTFIDRTRTLVEHERGKHVCPLCYPTVTEAACPVDHARRPHGGCTADMPTSVGARIRYQLDRESAAFKAAYNERTATERVNAQAKALGIERPHLRGQAAIANQNTLIYILINLRTLDRVRQRQTG